MRRYFLALIGTMFGASIKSVIVGLLEVAI